MKKRVLVIGGTGIMGIYLCPKLIECGYEVDAITIEMRKPCPEVNYIFADAMNDAVLTEIVKNGSYDAIVDFMWYTAETFAPRMDMLLSSTSHYFLTSSYRVYADSGKTPLTEESPRLYEVLTDPEFFETENYAREKSLMENMLLKSSYSNWTVLRPTVVYSIDNYPLVCFSRKILTARAKQGKKLILPRDVMDKSTTMIWAGDVAKMISGLMFKENVKREMYTVGTKETITWGELYEFYHEEIGLEAELIGTEDFLEKIYTRRKDRWLIFTDRLYDRAVDNSKILRDSGVSESELMSVRDGLRLVLSLASEDYPMEYKMDEYLSK